MVGKDTSAGGHFGRQMRKERIAHGWSLTEFAQRTDYDAGHLSRVENGRRPPTEMLAKACDEAFPERRGWFSDWYQESRTWAEVPAGFRSWGELEDKATRLYDWMPGIVTGMLQTEDYTRALIAVVPRTSPETAAARLANRMERQRRVLLRDDDPAALWFIVDELALYRHVGSPEIMAAQMRHLSAVAAMPLVTLQVLPAVAHSANASGFIVADDAAWCEHVVGGYAFTDDKTVSAVMVRFDTLRAESYRASESAALLERMADAWATGVSPLTRMGTAGSA